MHNQYQLILATDLDGTFLEGDHRSKSYFYNELVRLRDQIMLIYTTGRPVETVEHFCKRGYLPAPHFIMGDHGTHIVEGATFSSVEPLQNPIIQKWSNGNSVVRELLRDEIGIRLQPIDPPYRVAYYYDPDQMQHQTVQKIIDAGFDVIQSCDMYLDIVPRGVNKGSSLLRLLSHLNLSGELVVTCGDSLNDLSLFQTGLKGIAVGNSEPNLVAEIQNLNNVYQSACPGILGIIDGLQFYEKMELFQELLPSSK